MKGPLSLRIHSVQITAQKNGKSFYLSSHSELVFLIDEPYR